MKPSRLLTLLIGLTILTAIAHAEYVFTHIAGPLGGAGNADGAPNIARFNSPRAVAFDRQGNLFVIDGGNRSIRKVAPNGTVTTIGLTPGLNPSGLAVDDSGTLYVADSGTSVIYKITSQGSIAFAGARYDPFYSGNIPIGINRDGLGTDARFYQPYGLALDHSGNLYVADSGNQTIRKITPDGNVTTLAGTPNIRGSVDGTGSTARFAGPVSIAVDASGNLFVADVSTIRRVTPGGVVTTIAGAAELGTVDGVGSAARFNRPTLAIDSSNTLYISERGHVIRKVTLDGTVTTIAGLANALGSADGTGSDARFFEPGQLTVSSSGDLFIPDSSNDTIRQLRLPSTVSTFAGVAGNTGAVDDAGTKASFDSPCGIALDASGNLIIADRENHRIRKISPNGQVTTLAPGNGRFLEPSGVTVDASGNVYTSDAGANIVRKITPQGTETIFAGKSRIFGSADGTGSDATFAYPLGITIAKNGTLYVSDTANKKIRMVSPQAVVTTLNITSAETPLKAPNGLAVDAAGNIYVADRDARVVLKITPAGVLTVVAGSPDKFDHVDGVGSAARFRGPCGVVIDSKGNLIVTDDKTIRQITPTGVVTTIGGNPDIYGSADGAGGNAHFFSAFGLAIDNADNLYITEEMNSAIRKGTLNIGPSIQTHPQSLSVNQGASVQLNVVATGTPALTYQWQFNGTAINGATGSSFTLAGVTSANAGTYTVVVSNALGSVTSNAATLTVTSGSTPGSGGGNSSGASGGGGAPSHWFGALLALLTIVRGWSRRAR
ncbi:immunoglobulin domain-containing protein [Oleiharenicola lentus]|uniref:immunoglobulin domain-containing protein n=1 Tax=Oleiharenicola lentus TaxID=2508720 RepID=UPI003F665CF7